MTPKSGEAVEPVRNPADLVPHPQAPRPRVENPRLPVERTLELPIHGAGGIRIVAEVDGEETALPERPGLGKRPERRLEGLHHVTGPLDLRWLFAPEGTTRDLLNLWSQGMAAPVARNRRVG